MPTGAPPAADALADVDAPIDAPTDAPTDAPVRASAARWLVHPLTTIHGVGSLVVLGMAAYVLAGADHAQDLARTPGARVLVDVTGPWLPAFFAALALFLGALAWGSWRRRPWSWPAALAAYAVGVAGSLWQVSVGFARGWAGVATNGLVVALLLVPAVRRQFRA